MNELERIRAEERADAELSALLDGELEAAQATLLRRRVAADPVLAARLAELGEVDSQLRGLASAEPASERLQAIRAGLDRRLAEELRTAPGGRVTRLRGPARFVAPPAAALAAAIALYLAVGGSPQSDPNAGRPDLQAPPSIARVPVASPEETSQLWLADAESTARAEVASDEEVAIVLEYEMLADFDVIENLDLLEQMIELDSTERM
ncbi:MAG: hypothetical protein JRH17_08710 [Deltaproteobacteria bacterium]|nr:hypothetical protein [Deltaproteobacteria bacterium]